MISLPTEYVGVEVSMQRVGVLLKVVLHAVTGIAQS